MSDKSDKTQTITKQKAQSGNVSYGDTVVLHETSRTRVIFVPFFVQRTEGTELAVKIQTYNKGKPPLDWSFVDDKSISLKEPASRNLLSALRGHLAVAESVEDDGRYLVIPVRDGAARLGEHDPALVAAALIRALEQPSIAKHLAETDLGEEFVRAMRGAIRLREMRQAVTQLRTHLAEGDVKESIYQAWCEAHSWAFGNAYVMRDDVRNISASDNLDMLLPTVISGYRDIVELKRPDVNVLRWDNTHRNYYFSADTSQALGQCHRYLDVLHEVASKGLRDHPEIVAYHPRAIIVIGRSNDWDKEKHRALHGLNRRLAGISIMTYDHLLHQGERLVSLVSDTVSEDEPELDHCMEFEEDDSPF